MINLDDGKILQRIVEIIGLTTVLKKQTLPQENNNTKTNRFKNIFTTLKFIVILFIKVFSISLC